eukprot:gene10239-11333_t
MSQISVESHGIQSPHITSQTQLFPVLIHSFQEDQESHLHHIDDSIDRLGRFYQRIQASDALYCPDRTKLLPHCTQCIPGLERSDPSASTSSPCDRYIPASRAIRQEIRSLVVQRYGNDLPPNRTYGLYPYLEKSDFLRRHYDFGKLLSSQQQITHLVDIGAYYNPIHLFLGPGVCPQTIVVIEPILDALSVEVPCSPQQGGGGGSGGSGNEGGKVHIMFLPITFKSYIAIKDTLPRFDTVVCIGCDSHYGPSRHMLETTFSRPYTLYLEYPHDYIHNMPYRKMLGKGPGERLIYNNRFQVVTNETMYTKRVMKVIDYQVPRKKVAAAGGAAVPE